MNIVFGEDKSGLTIHMHFVYKSVCSLYIKDVDYLFISGRFFMNSHLGSRPIPPRPRFDFFGNFFGWKLRSRRENANRLEQGSPVTDKVQSHLTELIFFPLPQRTPKTSDRNT